MSKAPVLRRRIQGRKRYKWRICPYADCDDTNRIPVGERAPHPTTSGAMTLDIRDGHDAMGWRCDDDNCPYYKGNATTAIWVQTMTTAVNRTTGEYTFTPGQVEMEVGCSGTRFWEK